MYVIYLSNQVFEICLAYLFSWASPTFKSKKPPTSIGAQCLGEVNAPQVVTVQ